MSRFARTLQMLAAFAFAAALCSSPAAAAVRLLSSNVDWTTNGDLVHFQLHFDNPDPTPTLPVTGVLNTQAFGAFAPISGSPHAFDVPPIPPNSFFDVFVDIPLAQLPQNPPNIVPGGAAGGPCPPGNHWDGNVDITWSGAGGQGEVVRHKGEIRVCPGAGCSLIHVVTNCANVTSWTIAGLCPGFHATLVNADTVTAAPNPLPPGWVGWVCVTADAGTPVPTTCCFVIQFGCSGRTALVELCAITCNCNPVGANPQPGTIEWATLPGTSTVRFHVRWIDPSPTDPTAPAIGDMMSQEFGVFLPDYGPIGHFDVPAIQVNGFFDVFFDVDRSTLPPNPPTAGGPGPGGPCPPNVHWDGNVDIIWNGAAGGGDVHKHIAQIQVCPGYGASLIHFKDLLCGSALGEPWSITGLCQGFSATLVNEDSTTLAPNPVPPGWSGFIRITAAASTPIPDTCCFKVTFTCDGVPAVIDLCAITCNCNPTAPNPVPGRIGWETLPGTNVVRFHVEWDNPSSAQASSPISGDMNSQQFGVFLPDFGPIGHFDVPPIAPNSFFDVFTDITLDQLPPNPPTAGGPPPNGPCPPVNHWNGNVDITWNGPAGGGQVHKHIGEIVVCPGSGASLIHILSLTCASPLGMPWSVSGPCPGFSATLVNEDSTTAAPNPVPPGWTGFISVTAAPGTPIPDTCCFKVTFLCDGVPGVVDLCAITCDCNPLGPNPVPGPIDWTTQPNNMVRFHIRWSDPSTTRSTSPISGDMMSQTFGAFVPDAGRIGHFDVPAIAPSSFFDVFFDVARDSLPPTAQEQLVGGGPPPTGPCPPDDHWDGNVDIVWNGPAGGGQVNKHVGTVLVNTGGGSSLIHVISGCTVATGSSWTFGPICPGFTAVLLNEDHSPAPNPLPPGWTGWLSISAAGVPVGTTCCVDLTLKCGGSSAVIEVCAVACYWGTLDVQPGALDLAFGIRGVIPNPTGGQTSVNFALPKAERAKLEIFDAAGHRVRTLIDGSLGAGAHAAIWDGRDARGNLARPGTYFIRLSAAEKSTSRKLVVRP